MTLRTAMVGGSTRRAAMVGAFLFILSSMPTWADEATDAAGQFVRALADQAIGALTGSDVTQAQRTSRFRSIFVANFDVPALGKSALGRFWRTASNDEQEEYLKLFEDYVVSTYANRFREYTNEKLEVGEVGK